MANKFFIDTEFLEGTQKNWLGKNTKPTIDLISIGIVCEDGRSYYAISKDFNLKEAWNRWQPKEHNLPMGITKEYWLRNNVLKPIFNELLAKEKTRYKDFTKHHLEYLINKHGKTNIQIAEEVYNFCSNNYHQGNSLTFNQRKKYPLYDRFIPEFYGYYSDYDWVVFCWLFGKMIDLPNGFPMYCKDLKQSLDERNIEYCSKMEDMLRKEKGVYYIQQKYDIKNHKDYPKKNNEHNALADAQWNYELYKFLTNLVL